MGFHRYPYGFKAFAIDLDYDGEGGKFNVAKLGDDKHLCGDSRTLTSGCPRSRQVTITLRV
jgi:hypothetical protein